MPTATASENRIASMTGRPSSDVDDEDGDAQHAADLGQQPGEAGEPESGTRSGDGVRRARRRSVRTAVAAPVATTTASAEPSCTTVPMNRHDDSSASARRRVDRIGALRGRDRLAGEDRLVALEVARVQEPQVGRHDRTDVEVHDVARHEVGDLDARHGAPSRVTVTRWRISECIASAARSARYSLTKPSPTDATRIDPDDDGVEPLADEGRHGGRRDAGATATGCSPVGRAPTSALAWWERTAFGP